jgi:hypothetical protein
LPDDRRIPSQSTETLAHRGALARHAVPLSIVGVVALATRLYQLGSESLWIDEAITFGRMRLPLPELIADTIKRKHLPTYFLMLKGWTALGDSEWMLRFPSALFGALSALLTYGVGVLLHGRVAGLVAGLLIAVSAGQVHYGQEARMYALLTLATTLALFGLTWLARDPASAAAWPFRSARDAGEGLAVDASMPRAAPAAGMRPGWFAVLAGTVLALYTHNTAAFFVVALNVAAFGVWLGAPGVRAGWARNWLLCMACALALWSPWLPTLLGQTDDVREHWKGRAATYEWTRDVLRDLYAFGDVSGASGLLVLVLIALAAFALRDRKRLFFSTLLFATAGTLCAYAASQVVPMFYRRLLIWTGPPWFVLLGVGVALLPRIGAALVGGALLSLLIPGLMGYYARDTKPAWRPLIERLARESDERSLILSARAERFLTYYYERRSDPLPRRPFVKVRSPELNRFVRGESEFFLIGQTQEADFKQIQKAITRSHKYKAAWTQRHQNAILIKYRMRKSPPR